MCQYILYFAVPLKKNRIMLYAHHRSGYVCNPGALLQYLEAKHPGQWDLVWVTEYPVSVYAADAVSNIFEPLSEQKSLLPMIWSMKI